MKKFLFLFFLICLCSFSLADSITNYVVPSQVPLDKLLTITGQYNADVNSNVLCKFIILNSDGSVLIRLNDEYTFTDGTFYSEKKIIEPELRRGQDYNATTTCGAISATSQFSIVGREPVTDVFAFEFLYLRDNGFEIFLGLCFLVILAVIIGYFLHLFWDVIIKR